MHNYLIKDLMNVNRESSPRPIMEYLSDSGYRWLKISDFNLYDRYVYETKEFIKDAGLKNTRHLPAGTLILTNSATPGIPIFLGKDMCLHDGFLYFTNINENIININFLYYWFLYNRNLIINQANGSVFQNLKKDIVENFEIKVPDINIQLKIIKILDNINSKIELNNEINNNLYEMSLNIFNDFLNNNDAELIKLEDCVEKINTGADAIQRAPIVDYDTGVRCIRIGDMTNSRDYHSWGFTKMNDKDYDNYKLIKNDIIITRTAVNGLTYMITDEERVVCNNGNIRLRVNNKYNPLYIYLNTKTKDFRYYIDRINSETSVRPNMKVEYFTSYKIKKYSLEEQDKICNVIKPLFNKINVNKKEIYNLEQLRDTLLPKLMNGEIDLDNIEI